jgi:hypothetical protein
MPKSYLKGETTRIKTKFPSKVSVVGQPTWTLYDWENDVLVSGTATFTSDRMWEAEFTLPKALSIPDGEQELLLEYTALDGKGGTHTRSKTILVVDGIAQWQDFGVMVHSGASLVETTIFLEAQASGITLTLREGYGDTPIVLATQTVAGNALSYDTVTSVGFGYNRSLSLSTPLVNQSQGGLVPYQLVIEASFPAPRKNKVVIKPVYVLTPRSVTLITAMSRYLDKARLDDIDKALQWGEEEMLHFLVQGINYINGIGEASFWTLSQYPPNLQNHLFMAASWEALNARFLAEGMNSFEFQGANTQLTFNRRDAIQTKMDELRSVLDQYLPQAKASAIRLFGPGVAPAGSMPLAQNGLGVLGVALGPMTNRQRWLSGSGDPNPQGYRF